MISFSTCMPALSLLILSSTAVAIPPDPSSFPEFSLSDATPHLIIATVSAGKYLPEFAECGKPDVICIDPPPFWFSARIAKLVYGEAVGDHLKIATTSHYGMDSFLESVGDRAILIALVSNGDRYVMPRYASADLAQDRSGNFHLLLLEKRAPSWLPCAAWEMRREVQPVDFREDISLRGENAGYRQRQAPDMFRRVGKKTVPRYAIPMDLLSTRLSEIAPTAHEMACARE